MSEYHERMAQIRKDGPARTIYISHGAGGDWFVVEPQVGTQQSMADTPITTEMAVASLLRSGRTVYCLTGPELRRNEHRKRSRVDRLGLEAPNAVWFIIGFVVAAVMIAAAGQIS